jgi:hypothetical protein
MSGLMVECVDGPLAGAVFTVDRCPRVVRCVIAADGTRDILNAPEDAPRLDEAVHWYRWDGRRAGHICGRGRRGCMTWVRLVHDPGVCELRAPDPVNPGAARV